MSRRAASLGGALTGSGSHPNTINSGSRSHSSGSVSSGSPYGNTGHMLTPAVHSELEILKQKILMLERLVTYSQNIDSRPVSEPVGWQGRLHNSSCDLLGYNPYASSTETFSFHDNYVPFISMDGLGFRYSAPLSWVALIKVDNAVSMIFPYKLKNVLLKRFLTKDILNDVDNLQPAERLFQEKITTEVSIHEDSLMPDASNLYPRKRKVDFRKKINEKARALGLTVFEGDLDGAHDLFDKIQMVMPTYKVVWMLVDRFFARVYPFFPFVDQFDFEENLERILGSKTRAHEKIQKLHMQKRMDLAFLALLLMILRFGYLTLFTNSDAINEANFRSTDPSPKAQEIKFLMMNPIDMDVVDVAQMCLLQFGYLRVSNLQLLQLSLFIKLYFSFAPENGDSPEDTNSQSYTAMLINMAMSLGLHREPDNLAVKVRDDRTSNLCRKIWYYLLIIDLHNGMSNGAALCVRREMFDTSPPYYKPGNENVRDIEVEKEAVDSLRRIDRCYDMLNSVVGKISSVGAPLKLKDLCLQLSDLEIEYIKDQQPYFLQHIRLNLAIDVSQAISTKIYFQASFFLVSIAFHFFNFYERNGHIDLAYFYLKKVVGVAIYNMMPFYEDYVDKSHIWFQNSTDLSVTPSFQALVHKCMITIQAIMARARFSQLQCETLPTHVDDMSSNPEYKKRYELIVETFDLCDKCLLCFVNALSKLSSRFYYSWRCVKAYKGLKRARDGTDYYLNFCKGKEAYMLFSTPMLEDLNTLLKDSLDLVKKNQLQRPGTPMFVDDMFSGDSVGSSMPPPENPALPGDIDALWLEMMSMKPQMTKSLLFSRTPPTMDLGLGMFDFDPIFDGMVPPDNNFNIFDSVFDDPIGLDP